MAYPSITLFNKAINNQVFATKIKVIVTNAHVVGQEEVMRNKGEKTEETENRQVRRLPACMYL